jgi:hypothetical protein
MITLAVLERGLAVFAIAGVISTPFLKSLKNEPSKTATT